ncbi:MAG: CGNR zinc finger domain-containing protein [Actinomycetota bacterium]|nr:CGNR zinc finger domain-containing protein [Actinomycetota bacterium]
MTGESIDQLPAAGAQPGRRPPAPGRLAVVQAFVNTHFDLGVRFGADRLHSPAALADWMRTVGWPPLGRLTAADLIHALTLRESLRTAAAAGPDRNAGSAAAARLDAIAAQARVELRFGPDGATVTGARSAGLPGAMGDLLAIVAEAMRDGSWSRMKVCPGEHCGWLFYDRSRNRSGRWCSMSACGGRVKARRHYRRARGG